MRSGPLGRFYRGWWIVFTGYLAQLASVGSTGWVFGVLILPMQNDLGWSRSEIVGVVTVARLVNGAFGMLLGPYVDHYGARVVMTLSALGAGSCLVWTALLDDRWQYFLCWATLGLFLPGLSTVGPAVAIANWFVRYRARAVMAYTLGSATAGLLLSPLMSAVTEAFGWRAAWAAMSLLFFAVAPLAWTWVRQRPEDLGLHPDGLDPARVDAEGDEGRRAEVDPEPQWTVQRALRSRPFWLLTGGFLLTSFPAASIFIHMPSFVESKGFSSAEGATALSFYGAGVLAGRFTWGIVVERAGVYHALVAYGFGYGVSILLFVAPSGLGAIYATTVLLGISIAGAQQLHVQAYAGYFGRAVVGSLLGYAGVSQLVGATAPLIAAAVYDSTGGYALTFSLFGLMCLGAGCAFLLAGDRRAAEAA